MVTFEVSIENEKYAGLFTELMANLSFVKSVEIPSKNKEASEIVEEPVDLLLIPPITNQDPSIYCGIWESKKITDVKQFRNNLWQRSK